MNSFSPTLSDRRANNRILLDNSWTARLAEGQSAESFELSWDGIRLKLPQKIHLAQLQKLRVEIQQQHSSRPQSFLISCVIRWKREIEDGMAVGCEIESSPGASKLFAAIKKADVTFLQDRRGDPFKRVATPSGFPSLVPNPPEYRRFQEDRRGPERPASTRRSERPKYDRRHWIFQTICSVVTVVRDGLIPFLPTLIVRKLVPAADFAFICHPRDHRDVYRMFPFARFFPLAFTKLWFRFQWPFIASRISAHDPSSKRNISGWIVISPLWTSHMIKDTDLARSKITDAVLLSEKLGARMAGLGAFTSIVTHDGFDLLGKTKIGITTGNALSAAVAIANMVSAFDLVGSRLADMKIAVVGAAGSVGSGCSRALNGLVKELVLIDINGLALGQLINSLPMNNREIPTKVTAGSKLDELPSCNGVIVVTNAIGAVVNEKHLRPGAIVIDCAQPKNVSAQVPVIRRDVIVIESAIIKSKALDCNFDLDLAPEEALGCLAESIVLSAMTSKRPKLLGKVTLEQMKEVFDKSVKLGFRVAYFRNSHGYVTESDISRVRQYYASPATTDA